MLVYSIQPLSLLKDVPRRTERLTKLADIIARLPLRNFLTLRCIVAHLSAVLNERSSNGVHAGPLSMVFGPALFRSGRGDDTEDMRKQAQVCRPNTVSPSKYTKRLGSHIAFRLSMGYSNSLWTIGIAPSSRWVEAGVCGECTGLAAHRTGFHI